MDQNDACGTLYPKPFAGPYCDISCMRGPDWQCRVTSREICDGFSSCLTDECGCGEDVFSCADGVGCIAKDNLCNGFKDCKDGSDECMCENTVTCYIDEIKFCVPKELYCKGRLQTYMKCNPRAGEVNCGAFKADFMSELQNSPMFECIDNFYVKMRDQSEAEGLPVEKAHGFDVNKEFEKFCTINCDSGYKHFCPLIDMKTLPGIQSIACDDQRFHVRLICDGNFDCDNGADEKDCPGRYYCTEKQVRPSYFLGI